MNNSIHFFLRLVSFNHVSEVFSGQHFQVYGRMGLRAADIPEFMELLPRGNPEQQQSLHVEGFSGGIGDTGVRAKGAAGATEITQTHLRAPGRGHHAL